MRNAPDNSTIPVVMTRAIIERPLEPITYDEERAREIYDTVVREFAEVTYGVDTWPRRSRKRQVALEYIRAKVLGEKGVFVHRLETCYVRDDAEHTVKEPIPWLSGIEVDYIDLLIQAAHSGEISMYTD